ncbi:uncharacterized protein LOC135089439 [Scylla paramamosain]|uniref:uncharacterized protein LOC135089439 n=1 Tax=Scylla paramamosain TaxID=85552 RepID=UPI0030834E4B
MQLLVFTSLVAATAAASLQGYNLPIPGSQGFSHGGSGIFAAGAGLNAGSQSYSTGFTSGGSGFTSGGSGFTSGSSGFTSGVSGGAGLGSCGEGQVRHVDGGCVTPQVTTNLYVYRAPNVAPIIGPRPNVGPPRLEHNIVFIHTPNGLFSQEPIVVPPPQQKNVVYVLNKRPHQDHNVIEVPKGEQEAPEIYFVNYAEGENPTLPLGGDLQSALSKAEESNGEIIGDTGLDVARPGVGPAIVGPTGVATPSGLYTSP